MENRFLCRAKRIDTGEWVTGYYVKGMDTYEKEVHLMFEPTTTFYSHGETGGFVEVDPSTICQCTELKDDDGTLIFENDVLSLKDEINESEWKALVKFGNPNAEYTWGWQLVPITECDDNKDILLWVETEMGYMYCNIIGNRFDNPELLE